MLLAACPACDARYRVPDAAAGKRTTCKKCGAAFRIPATSAGGQLDKSRARAPASSVAAERREPAGEACATGFLDALDALADGQVLDTPPSEPAPPIATTAVAAPAASRRANANAPAPPTWSPPALESEEDDPGVLAYPRYIKAVGRSFAVFTSVGNVITFLILWFMLCVRHIAIGY